MRTIFECTHNAAEGAGAAPIAAILQERERLSGSKVGAVLSGGNVDRQVLGSILAGQSGDQWSDRRG
jgi:threonine dehydratase